MSQCLTILLLSLDHLRRDVLGQGVIAFGQVALQLLRIAITAAVVNLLCVHLVN